MVNQSFPDDLLNYKKEYQMGQCASRSHHKNCPISAEFLQKIKNISIYFNSQVPQEEIKILHLMYLDLSERTIDRKINLENFLLFFHKNGFWGERLFKQFDSDETNLISEQQFIRGIVKIFKSTERDKISLLFKFFSKDTTSGVYFHQFLTMLYNYPKEDLKEILNDKQFFQMELKKRMVLIDRKNKDDEDQIGTYRLQSGFHIKPILAEGNNFLSDKTFDRNNVQYEVPIHSVIGRDIIRSIKDKYKTNQTVISFKHGDKTYDLRTSNIQQLVKRFATRIFEQANIDINQGKLNFHQFYQWISTHKTLYQNYYDGFHNTIWEIDPFMKKPKYMLQNCQKKSQGLYFENQLKIKVVIILYHSVLVICPVKQQQSPLRVICLQGLIVKRAYSLQQGFGFMILHRDGIYQEKQVFLKNEDLLFQWMELLKYYKGESVQKKYQIGEKIGTGKFSVVYRCRNIIEDKLYALKQIATFKLDSDAKNLIAQINNNLSHESSIMQIVSHPLLLEFKEVIQTKTHIYIITQLVKGPDLFDYVKQMHFLEEYDAAKIAQQLIVGVRFLHSFQMVHRDLKPENVMVNFNFIQVVIDEQSGEISNIKIIDFGFSNYLSKLKQASRDQLLAGTPNYIAPEILKQEPFDNKIDNFAVGVIIYFMLTGKLPFNGATLTQILENTIRGQFRFSDRRILSQNCMNIITLLLKNQPSQRICLQQALKHPWFDILKSPRNITPKRSKKKGLFQ